jgi:hypothetical protein
MRGILAATRDSVSSTDDEGVLDTKSTAVDQAIRSFGEFPVVPIVEVFLLNGCSTYKIEHPTIYS